MMVLKRVSFFLLVASMACAQEAKRFPVSEFGAVADGKTVNTVAIQKAIDQAAASGGGVVEIPTGTWRSGSIFLKPGVDLHLAEGAVLLGSTEIEDYPKRETRIEGHFEPWRLALVNAQGMDRARISCKGVLDGNGITFWAKFWQRRRENPKCTNLEVERPRLMFIDRCKDVRIEGISPRYSGFWNLHLYRCSDVLIQGLTITAPTRHTQHRKTLVRNVTVKNASFPATPRCSRSSSGPTRRSIMKTSSSTASNSPGEVAACSTSCLGPSFST